MDRDHNRIEPCPPPILSRLSEVGNIALQLCERVGQRVGRAVNVIAPISQHDADFLEPKPNNVKDK